jgi:RPA family protein
MECATKVFAGELCRSDLTIKGQDTDNASWVVTPGGAWCDLLFIAGALTEVSESGDMLHCRVADPTGAFNLTIGGRKSPLIQAILNLPVPSFVTISGRAQMYRKGDTPVVSIRPDHVQGIDRSVRDQWILMTSEAMLGRLEQLHGAMKGRCHDDRTLVAFRHYAITTAQIEELASMVKNAIQSVRAPKTGTEPDVDIHGLVMEIIRANHEPRGIAVEEVIETAGLRGISQQAVLTAIEALIVDDECYQPQKGHIKPL